MITNEYSLLCVSLCPLWFRSSFLTTENTQVSQRKKVRSRMSSPAFGITIFEGSDQLKGSK